MEHFRRGPDRPRWIIKPNLNGGPECDIIYYEWLALNEEINTLRSEYKECSEEESNLLKQVEECIKGIEATIDAGGGSSITYTD